MGRAPEAGPGGDAGQPVQRCTVNTAAGALSCSGGVAVGKQEAKGRGRETGDEGKGDEAELVVGFESEDGKVSSEDMTAEEWGRQTEKTLGVLLAAKVERCGTEDLTDGERALWKEMAERIGAKVKAEGIESLGPMERTTWRRMVDVAAGPGRGDEVISSAEAAPPESVDGERPGPERHDGRCEECGREVGDHLRTFHSANRGRVLRLCPTCCALSGAAVRVDEPDTQVLTTDSYFIERRLREDTIRYELAHAFPVLARVAELVREWCGMSYDMRGRPANYDDMADELRALHEDRLSHPDSVGTDPTYAEQVYGKRWRTRAKRNELQWMIADQESRLRDWMYALRRQGWEGDEDQGPPETCRSPAAIDWHRCKKSLDDYRAELAALDAADAKADTVEGSDGAGDEAEAHAASAATD